MRINYTVGDATEPQGDGNKVIVHCCNCVGAWGSGFVVALSRKWPQPQEEYDRLELHEHSDGGTSLLGHIQFVKVKPDVAVCNLIGQYPPGGEMIGKTWIPPIDYRAMTLGFAKIKQAFLSASEEKRFSLHAPRLGCDRAGGKWEIIEGILHSVFDDTDIDITIYDLPKDPKHNFSR